MRIRKQLLAQIFLYLSLSAALVSIGLYIVLREFNLPLQISLGLMVIGLALFVFLNPQQIRVALTGRQARYGSNALVMTLAFLGILVVINYLVYKNPKRWDLTENQQFTLASETLDTLEKLPQPVLATAFYTSNKPSEDDRGLLDQYKFHGKGKFDYQFIDPNANPVAARDANIQLDGTVVFTMGERREEVTFVTEREITSALVRLISSGPQAVYFLTGHGEFNPDGSGDDSYSQAKATLEKRNYKVSVLNLLVGEPIPEDAQVIIIAGPTKPLVDTEVKLLEEYLKRGGSLIAMEDPLPLTDFGDAPDPLADYFVNNWGITLGKDIVVDLTANQLFGQPLIAVQYQYGEHIITQEMSGMATLFPAARSVTVDETMVQLNATELVFTSPQSWAETSLASLINAMQSGQSPQIEPNEGEDMLGPIPLAVAAEDTSTQARLVVFGDSDFASNVNFNQYGNSNLFINSVDWATEQENIINLSPKEDTPRLFVPPQRSTMNLILLGTVFILPGSVLVAGLVVWFQRRRRG